jgi:uncharacterized membrane protein YeaQ/YmgE (transglycosylase-associated protein family)
MLELIICILSFSPAGRMTGKQLSSLRVNKLRFLHSPLTYDSIASYNIAGGVSVIVNILLQLLFGAVVGWLASIIMKSSLSLIMSIVLGVVGSIVGGQIAGFFGIGGGFVVELLIAVGGACLVVFVARKFSGKR